MYTYDNKIEQEKQLKDITKNGKDRDWQGRKLKTLLLADSYKRLGMKKSYRVAECGTFLEFRRSLVDSSLKLTEANFCKVRLCPMCSWRRSLKIFGQVSKVMNKALEDREYRFIFLTLTCKNIQGVELSDTIDKLFKAYNLLTKRKQFRLAVKGWFRALEITHNLDDNSKDYDTYHPHFHIVLMVNKSYFTDTNYYISQEQWTSLWKSCLRVDYTPIVDVRAFRSASKIQTSKSVAESAKYTVKDNDYIIPDDEELTDDAVMILDYSLTNRRLVAFGGELRKIHRALNLDDMEKGDLVHTDNEEDELREDIDTMIERYRWHVGYKQYVKVEVEK